MTVDKTETPCCTLAVASGQTKGERWLGRRYYSGAPPCMLLSTDPAGPQIPVAEVPRSLGRAVLVLLTSVTWRAVFCPFHCDHRPCWWLPHGVGLDGVP